MHPPSARTLSHHASCPPSHDLRLPRRLTTHDLHEPAAVLRSGSSPSPDLWQGSVSQASHPVRGVRLASGAQLVGGAQPVGGAQRVRDVRHIAGQRWRSAIAPTGPKQTLGQQHLGASPGAEGISGTR